MNKLMNNRGFTLIELLATIVILSLISVVTVVSVTNSYQKSKEKAEEAFIQQLKRYIDDYIAFNGSKLDYVYVDNYDKCYINYDGNEICDNVVLEKNSDVGIEDVSIMVASSDFVNPLSEIKCNNSNINLTIYRDNDFKYCFILSKNGESSCINENIDTCSGIYKGWNEN